jgi:hypothetical protein
MTGNREHHTQLVQPPAGLAAVRRRDSFADNGHYMLIRNARIDIEDRRLVWAARGIEVVEVPPQGMAIHHGGFVKRGPRGR